MRARGSYILIFDKKISQMKDILPVLEQIARAGKPLLIVAEEVEGEALATLVVKQVARNAQCVRGESAGLRRPPQGNVEDISILTGARPSWKRRASSSMRQAGGSRPRQARHGGQGQHDHRRWRGTKKNIEAGSSSSARRSRRLLPTTIAEKLQERLQAGRRSGGDQSRRRDRDGDEGEKARVEMRCMPRAAVEEGIVPGADVRCCALHRAGKS